MNVKPILEMGLLNTFAATVAGSNRFPAWRGLDRDPRWSTFHG